MGEKWLVKFSQTIRLGSFSCRKAATWDSRLYFPSEGRHAKDFYARENPTVSAGFEPANLGTRARPPKPLDPRLRQHDHRNRPRVP
jgi:hypothetical protein